MTIIKPGTKECSLLNNKSSLLHRAFSVFLFDPQGDSAKAGIVHFLEKIEIL